MHNNKVLLIIGGTSGIGKAKAYLAAQKGFSIVIAGRNIERGQQIVNNLVNQRISISFL